MRNVKVTPVVRAVMRSVLAAPPDQPAYGLSICQTTGYGTQSVYPALNRLRNAGWVTAWWETPTSTGRPRRFYAATYDAAWYGPRLAAQPRAEPRRFVSTALTKLRRRREPPGNDN